MTDTFEAFYIDYERVFENSRTFKEKMNIIDNYIRPTWIEHYRQFSTSPTSICRFTYEDFTFIFDDTDELINEGVAKNDNIANPRVVAAFGVSKNNASKRNASRMRGYLGATSKIYAHFGTDYDKGHFMANASGGPLEINLFPQKRDINRGWSEAGKRYRSMEQFVAKNPGTFIFSRPFYRDLSLRPSAIEFGYLTTDGKFASEVFTNT